MEPFTGVAIALAGPVVKAVLQFPDEDGWSSAVSSVLAAVLSQQGAAQQTLDRIESKIDRLARQPYESKLRAGLRSFNDAQPAHRSPEERGRLITRARDLFVDAESAAPDLATRAFAEWHIAMAWLVGGSLPDALSSLLLAREHAFNALLDARKQWCNPT